MFPDTFRRVWSNSGLFRAVLAAALAFTALRLIVQVVYLSGALAPAEFKEADGSYIPIDLKVYLTAADNFQRRQDLYLEGRLPAVEFFQYSPLYAFAFIPFTWLSPAALIGVHSLIHVGAYVLLYGVWWRLFDTLQLPGGPAALVWALPLWLAYAPFWGDWAYMNIYVVMALLGSLLIEAVLRGRLGPAILLLAVIAQLKPQWAFAALLPALLGRFRFFAQLLAGGFAAYAALTLGLMAWAGPAYVLGQYRDYALFLMNLAANFPWRGPEAAFPGYNHSVMQTILFWLGPSPGARLAATGVKIALLLPLAVVVVRALRRPDPHPRPALDLAFALYLGAFIWLDWVWELALGVVVYAYLMGTGQNRATRLLTSAVFWPYALMDVWRLGSVAVFGLDVIAGGDVLTDPSIYIPTTLIVILTMYGVLIMRQFRRQCRRQCRPAPAGAEVN